MSPRRTAARVGGSTSPPREVDPQHRAGRRLCLSQRQLHGHSPGIRCSRPGAGRRSDSSADEVEAFVLQSAEDLGVPGRDPAFGAAFVRPGRAVAAASTPAVWLAAAGPNGLPEAIAGQPVELRASVVTQGGSQPGLAGAVSFSQGGVALGTVSLVGGSAALLTSALPASSPRSPPTSCPRRRPGRRRGAARATSPSPAPVAASRPSTRRGSWTPAWGSAHRSLASHQAAPFASRWPDAPESPPQRWRPSSMSP